MKRVLVTGASGFIGRHLLAPLVERGYEVHAVSRTGRPLEPDAVHRHTADLLQAGAAAELMARVQPSHLLHLAWIVQPDTVWTSPENLAWLEASIRLFRTFLESGGRRALGVGSCAEYDWIGDGICSEASTPVRPASLYGAAKAAAAWALSGLAALHGASSAWARVFFIYGPYEPAARLAPSLAGALLRGQPAVCRHGSLVRDFLHVSDAARALVTILNSEWTGPINVGSGQGVALSEILSILAREAARPDLARDENLPPAPGEPHRLIADVDALASLGFRPEIGLEDGLRRTLNWWRNQSPEPAAAAW